MDHGTATAHNPDPHPAPRAFLILDSLFLFIMFLSWTTPLGIPNLSADFTFPEITVFLYILWRVATLPGEKPTSGKLKTVLLWGLWLSLVWIVLIWLSAPNWRDRRSPLIDWILAVSLFTLFVRIPPKHRHGLKLMAILFALSAIPNALAGIHQHFWGSGLRNKDLLGWNWRAESSPIKGFFSSPNDLAIYMFWALMLSLGIARGERRWNTLRIVFSILTVMFGLTLYWTYSRLALLGAGCAVAGIFLMPWLPKKRMLWLASAVPVVAAGIVFWISTFYPIRKLFSRRLVLWERTIHVLFQEPSRAAFGYLSTEPLRGPLSVWWIPHNIYLLAWMEFGIPGFLGLAALAFFVLACCWSLYEHLRENPLPAALSAGMLGMLFIIGIGSLYLYEGFTLFIFFALLGLWTNLLGEIPPSPQADSQPRAAALQTDGTIPSIG